MEPTKLNRNQAEEACFKKEAALFVADSGEEFKTVVSKAPRDEWSWIGLIRHNGSSLRDWTGSASVDNIDFDWLSTPFSSQANGWSPESICAAYYGAEAYSIANIYFYPCTSLCFSICERNTTLVK
ncbi:hypothetical protein Q1695_015818 [Nippostrongylus brasiliensis]|nr:hypothetical protein Q1695_015818 [Nippostrongylus brasiliensis]